MKRISLARARPRSKYRAQPTEVNGHRFDSKGEAARYVELRFLERMKIITDLRLQVRFSIEVNGQKIATYVADFVYREKGVEVIEDFKSPATAKNPVYRLKKKLVEAIYGIEIRETSATRRRTGRADARSAKAQSKAQNQRGIR
jgi:hypothetical protein